MRHINISYYKNNGINFIIGTYEDKLCLFDSIHRKNKDTIYNRLKKELKADFIECEDKIIKKTKKQLDEYFDKKRKEFDIPLLMIGTPFQKSVWNSLLDIPYGQTSSYKGQSKTLGDEKKVRAVANANGANAISIIIPCHRIIGSDGKLNGYAGGVELKKRLLELEGNSFD